MSDSEGIVTTYVPGEGRPQLEACMWATFNYCRANEIEAIVIYTANGEGPCLAVERFLAKPEFAHIRLVAVTPAANRRYVADPRAEKRSFVRTGIFGEKRKLLHDSQVQIVSARLPFRSLATSSDLGAADPMHLVERAFGILGGGFSFCIQAVLMACDAGAITTGERVAAMSADTALVVIASQSESFLSPAAGLLVQHIICRPLHYDISKRAHISTRQALEEGSASGPQAETPQLDLGIGKEPSKRDDDST